MVVQQKKKSSPMQFVDTSEEAQAQKSDGLAKLFGVEVIFW